MSSANVVTMSFFNFFFNSPSRKDNATILEPKHTIKVTLHKKHQKYVDKESIDEQETDKGLLDKCTSMFRPKTPQGMQRIVENRPIITWTITIYKKKRISVSFKIDYYDLCSFRLIRLQGFWMFTGRNSTRCKPMAGEGGNTPYIYP